MRLRPFFRNCAALALAIAVSAPVLAHDHPQPGTAPAGPDMRPEWRGDHAAPADSAARDAWLGECRRRMSFRDDGWGGAIIGGVAGGFAGNRIAGRRHRTAGTIAGAAIGAAAGAAIDKAEDKGRLRDECETYYDDYYAYYARASHGYGYAYGQGAAACCQPVAMPRKAPECTETIEEIYEDVAPRPRPRARSLPAQRDKRIKVQ